MENKTIARTFRLLSQLMELHSENPFKIKTIATTAYKIDKLAFSIANKTLPEIEGISGIGRSTASKVWELLQTGRIKDLEDLLNATPAGVVEILKIKGIGPKKVQVIWNDLGIENVGELLYACNENRLVEAKGFGLKTQEEIRSAIEFAMASSGRYLYAQVEDIAEELLSSLKKHLNTDRISFTADYRRRCEIIDGLDILIGSKEATIEKLGQLTGLEVLPPPEVGGLRLPSGVKAFIKFCADEDFAYELAIQTGNSLHAEELKKRLKDERLSVQTEAEVYAAAGLPFIEPELREGLGEFELAERDQLPKLIEFNDLKGTLHNHSTWSDGVHTLEEMALFCRDDLTLEYLGICDHSKSAFYANGLSEDRVLAQHEEIEQLNKQLSPFKIFKGIESDILFDGSLDYPAEILASFDFVVASIHSVLKMNEEKATSRLIKAIENPFTTILGHPTGRMLLTRSGYPIDYKKVIDACAANNVIIEINSNPLRLDIDWRWHRYALEKGVMLSINPDAHRKDRLNDTRYGVLAARKGGVSASECLNALSLKEISTYFINKKSAISI